MPYRKIPFVKGEVYHITCRSIADYRVFNTDEDCCRIIDEIKFYAIKNPPHKFCLRDKVCNETMHDIQRMVNIVAYCAMPTHLHLLMREATDGGISKFMNLILKSYSMYFNLKHGRKGPLWESRFKSTYEKTESQLIHTTRYIHLNPVTAYMVNNPTDWKYSSYREYIGLVKEKDAVCDFSYIGMSIEDYKEFVMSQISYQRELALTKNTDPHRKWFK